MGETAGEMDSDDSSLVFNRSSKKYKSRIKSQLSLFEIIYLTIYYLTPIKFRGYFSDFQIKFTQNLL